MSTVTAPASTGRGQYAGTARLVRLALRRDRIQLPVWLLALTALQVFSASSVFGLYPTEADLRGFAWRDRAKQRQEVATAHREIYERHCPMTRLVSSTVARDTRKMPPR